MEHNPWMPREEYLRQKREGTIAPKEKVNPCVDLIDLLRKIQVTDNDARSMSFISSLMQQHARSGGISPKQDEIARQIAIKYGVIEGELPPEETYEFDIQALSKKIKKAGGTYKDLDFCASVENWIEFGNKLTKKQFEALKRIEAKLESESQAKREEPEVRVSRREEQEIDPYSISRRESSRREQAAIRDRDELGQSPNYSKRSASDEDVEDVIFHNNESDVARRQKAAEDYRDDEIRKREFRQEKPSERSREPVSPWRAKWMAAEQAYNYAKSNKNKDSINLAIALFGNLDVTRPDIYAKIAELEELRDGPRVKKNPSDKLTESEKAEYDREIAEYNKQFKKMNAARKRDGLPQVQTSFGGSWAHEQDFLKRIKRNPAKMIIDGIDLYKLQSDLVNKNDRKMVEYFIFLHEHEGKLSKERREHLRDIYDRYNKTKITRNPKREINPMNLSASEQKRYDRELAAYNKRNGLVKNPPKPKSKTAKTNTHLIDIHKAIKNKMRKP